MNPMPEIAMYYPYIHFRDDNWLKAAALYWPRLARLTPSGYPQYDSEVAKALEGELGFILNIEPPSTQVSQVADEFRKFVAMHHAELKWRYASKYTPTGARLWTDVVYRIAGTYPRPYVRPDPKRSGPKWPDDPLWGDVIKEMTAASRVHHGWVHIEKMGYALGSELTHHGLGTIADHDNWVVTHPAIGAAYTLTLVDRVAKANQLAVVTDQARLHELHGGGIGAEFASFLLDAMPEIAERRARTADDITELYASLAIKTVIPRNIEHVPVGKIIKARTELAAEFDIFREHLSALTGELSTLTQVENLAILTERLQMMVDRDLRRPTAALERSLRQMGLEPAKAVLGAKSPELPAFVAGAASAAGLPVIAGQTGLATARLIAASAQTRSKQREARQSSPVGYLLGLKRRIGRRGIIDRTFHRRG